jgi:hypothetical protein
MEMDENEGKKILKKIQNKEKPTKKKGSQLNFSLLFFLLK